MKHASIFDDVVAPVPRYMMRLEHIQNLLDVHVPAVSRFLEIGPGLGDIAAYMLNRHPNAIGQVIEFSETAVRQLLARFATSNRLSVCTDNFLEYTGTGDFDLIMAFEVLEHIEHDMVALKRIHAALESGGFFLMSVPAYMKKWQKADDWAGHFRRYEKLELQDKLVSSGFRITHMSGYGFPITSLLYPLRQLYYRKGQGGMDATEKLHATKQSGIFRPVHAPGWGPWVARLMKPLFLMQHAARNTDLGDGWIVLAQKL